MGTESVPMMLFHHSRGGGGGGGGGGGIRDDCAFYNRHKNAPYPVQELRKQPAQATLGSKGLMLQSDTER